MSVFHFRTSLGLSSKEFACNVRDMGSVPGLGRSPGKGNGNLVQRLPGKPHGQRSLAGCRPWGHKRVRCDSATRQQQQRLISGSVPVLLYVQLCGQALRVAAVSVDCPLYNITQCSLSCGFFALESALSDIDLPFPLVLASICMVYLFQPFKI